MARKLYDLAVKTGQYQDQQGNTKGRWQNVGAVMQGDDGGKFIMLARWFSPAGVPDFSGKGSGESILLSMFEPKDQNGQQGGGGGYQQQGGQPRQQQRQAPPPQQQRAPQNQYDDDIPF